MLRWLLHVWTVVGLVVLGGDVGARPASQQELDLLVTLGHPPSEVFRGAEGARRLLGLKGVVHLERLQFETEAIEAVDARKSRLYRRQAGRFSDLAAAYERVTANGTTVSTYTQWSASVKDYDVFAAAPIAAGTLIGEYTGIVRALDAVEDASTIGGGQYNLAAARYTSIGGGWGNMAMNRGATIPGGGGNIAEGEWAAIGGGRNNNANGYYSVVAGGQRNTVVDWYGAVLGGDGGW